MNIQRPLFLVLIPLLMLASGARAAEENLTDLDLTTLMGMDVTVTSASRRAQAMSDAAAAVFVITRDDIRRSGASTLPDVLRMAPGLQVGRVNTRSWAVSARGFNNRFANKLLVMVDGRSIYSTTFSGVMWEEQPVFLDDIERIEIVRGPGGALWGINAVNGVINIITRSAAQTHGLHVSAGGGSGPAESGSLRLGGDTKLGDYRVYIDRSESEALRSTDADWGRTLVGFRLDRAAIGGMLTLQGDLHEADFGKYDGTPEIGLSNEAHTGSTLANWRRDYAGGELELRTFYSWVRRGQPIEWNESALGFDAQFSARRLGRHTFTAGMGLRRITDEQSNASGSFAITSTTQNQWSLYGQDELRFFDDSVRVIAGAKLEKSEFTGTAFQPTLRTLWNAGSFHTVWAAASRAERTPSRFELHSDFRFPISQLPPLPVDVVISGQETLKAEDLHAYEIGWRWRPSKDVSMDLAAYRNEYDHLIMMSSLPPRIEFGPPPRVAQPLLFANAGSARMNGLEVTTEWAARDWLRLQASGAWQDVDDVELSTPISGTVAAQDAARVLSAKARIDLPRDGELDLGWRSVSETADRAIGAYDSVNARLAWRPVRALELSVSIDNLLDEQHAEAYDLVAVGPGATLDRTYFARFVWQPSR